jgi:hypothetical protein
LVIAVQGAKPGLATSMSATAFSGSLSFFPELRGLPRFTVFMSDSISTSRPQRSGKGAQLAMGEKRQRF